MRFSIRTCDQQPFAVHRTHQLNELSDDTNLDTSTQDVSCLLTPKVASYHLAPELKMRWLTKKLLVAFITAGGAPCLQFLLCMRWCLALVNQSFASLTIFIRQPHTKRWVNIRCQSGVSIASIMTSIAYGNLGKSRKKFRKTKPCLVWRACVASQPIVAFPATRNATVPTEIARTVAAPSLPKNAGGPVTVA